MNSLASGRDEGKNDLTLKENEQMKKLGIQRRENSSRKKNSLPIPD